MTEPINIKIVGLDKVNKNLAALEKDLPVYLQGARIDVTDEILNTQGLRKYPPATSANQPPVPYYIRGRGMQTSASRNNNKSERLGTRWLSVPYSRIGMRISNPASYAPYVHGDDQARHMAKKGWRKLYDVAKGKTKQIGEIYSRWIDKLIKKHNL
jgi:hypothetical protein